jgi:outer membrane protein assembly factor BamB
MRWLKYLILFIPMYLSAWTFNLSWDEVLDAHTTSATGIYDILGDSVPELLIPGNQNLYCYGAEGQYLWTFTPYSTYFPAVSSPIASDIDSDGDMEIVVNSANRAYSLDSLGGIEWEFTLPSPGSVQNCISSPALGDVNGDGKLEVFVCAPYQNTMYCLDPVDGSILWEFTPQPISYIIICTPTIADIDIDGDFEILIGTMDDGGGGRLFCLDDTGSVSWEYTTPGSGITGWQLTSACVGDINGDDTLEVVSTSNYRGIFCLDCHGNEIWNNVIGEHSASYPAMGDIDSDGNLEVVAGLGPYMISFDGATGDIEWTFPVDGGYYIVSSPGLGDFNEDGFLEVVFTELKQGSPNDSTRKMWVLDYDGNEIWSDTVGTSFSDPTIGDTDDDGFMDFLVGPTYLGFRFWNFEADTGCEAGRMEWRTLQHDIYRTGLYGFQDTTTNIYEKDIVNVTKDTDIFPNPAQHFIDFSIGKGSGVRVVSIYNISGRKVKSIKCETADDGRIRLNVSDLTAGIYFVKQELDRGKGEKFLIVK